QVAFIDRRVVSVPVQLHPFSWPLIPDRREVDITDQLFGVSVFLHRKIQERLRSIKSINPPGTPGVFVDETESLSQNQQLVSHQIGCQVSEDQSVDQVRFVRSTMGIVLHLADLVEQTLRGELLVRGNRREEFPPST